MKTKCLLVVSLLIVVGFVASFAWAQQEEVKLYKAGALFPLSGGGAAAGKALVAAMEMAIEEINAAGGIDGVKMQGVYEDHKGRSEAGVSGFRKMITMDKVPISTTGYTAVSLAVAPIATENKILIINGGAVSPLVRGCSPYFFSNIPNGTDETNVVVDYAVKDLGLKRIGVLWTNEDLGRSMTAYLKEYLPKIGATFVGDEAYDRDCKDFTSQITKAKGWNADAIYYISYTHTYNLLKQGYELGLRSKWLGYSGTEYFPEIFTVVGKPAESVIYGVQYHSPEASPRAKAWFDKYVARTGLEPGSQDLNSYDYIYILKKLIEEAKKKGGNYYTGERLREALLKILEFPGVMGPTIFDPQTGACAKPMAVKTFIHDSSTGRNRTSLLKKYSVETTRALRK